jgi:hypothetical protein
MLFSIAGYSSSNPILDFVIYYSDKIEVSIANGLENNSRISVKLIDEVLSFKTLNKIKNIKVYNTRNKLLYRIPIDSKKLEIKNELFNAGIYKVNFYFYNNDKPLSIRINFKE